MLNRRVHVAVVFTNSTVTAYFDGAPLGTRTWSLGVPKQPCEIGASTTANDERWQGTIDELAIYTNALSAQTIAQHADLLNLFANTPITGLPDVGSSSVAWADYDNDGRLDFLLTCFAGSSYLSQLWRNRSPATNTPPTAPTGLAAQPNSPGSITLSWRPA